MADDPNKPWWAPDAQGFLAMAIVSLCGMALFIRMASTSTVDDKMLDTMITILFSTCLVTVYNYSFGSSRGTQTKDEAQTKIVEKLTSPPVVPVSPLPIPIAWWTRLKNGEPASITAFAATDPRTMTIVTAMNVGAATPDDLSYLVSKGLLTPERATAIQSA